jgi:hypothetical protein
MPEQLEERVALLEAEVARLKYKVNRAALLNLGESKFLGRSLTTPPMMRRWS